VLVIACPFASVWPNRFTLLVFMTVLLVLFLSVYYWLVWFYSFYIVCMRPADLFILSTMLLSLVFLLSYRSYHSCTCSWWGTAFLLRDSAVIVNSPPCPVFKSFELSFVTLKRLHSKLTVYKAYLLLSLKPCHSLFFSANLTLYSLSPPLIPRSF